MGAGVGARAAQCSRAAHSAAAGGGRGDGAVRRDDAADFLYSAFAARLGAIAGGGGNRNYFGRRAGVFVCVAGAISNSGDVSSAAGDVAGIWWGGAAGDWAGDLGGAAELGAGKI